MKQLILLFILLFNFGVFGQNKEYSIIVKDIETQLPIENATVVILKTKQILLSNSEGRVTFVLNGISNIQVSETNYKSITLRWAALEQSQFVAYLESKNNKLDEIVLSKESPQKILRKVVANSITKITTSYRLKVYAREFFMLDNKYSYYNDGLINFQFTANQKKLNTTLLVEQNRSYGLLETDISADLKGYNLNNIMENYCSFKYFEPILDSKAKKQYDYLIKAHSANNNYYVMTVAPLDKAKKGLDDFEIIYDPEKKIILEFTIHLSPMNLAKIEEKPANGSKIITRSFVKVNYRLDGLNYYVLSSNEEIGFDVILKNKVKNIKVRNSFVTTNFSKQNFTYKDSDVFTEKSLFNKKNKILTNYWDISGFTATNEEKKIIQQLEYKM